MTFENCILNTRVTEKLTVNNIRKSTRTISQ